MVYQGSKKLQAVGSLEHGPETHRNRYQPERKVCNNVLEISERNVKKDNSSSCVCAMGSLTLGLCLTDGHSGGKTRRAEPAETPSSSV